MKWMALFMTLLTFNARSYAAEYTVDQRLIVACHRLDVDGVVTSLRDGANVNSRFGWGDNGPFHDKWTLGWPGTLATWTPLITLTNAPEYPDPPRKIENTMEDLKWAIEERKKIPADQIENRQRARMTIAMILLSHKADVDAADSTGATALFDSVYPRQLELAKLLIRFNANVNTKTKAYIDGPSDMTPLHNAYWSVELTKLLIEKGADVNAKDSRGRTPADWARGNEEVQRLYKKN